VGFADFAGGAHARSLDSDRRVAGSEVGGPTVGGRRRDVGRAGRVGAVSLGPRHPLNAAEERPQRLNVDRFDQVGVETGVAARRTESQRTSGIGWPAPGSTRPRR
jgi:hypothetical protein